MMARKAPLRRMFTISSIKEEKQTIASLIQATRRMSIDERNDSDTGCHSGEEDDQVTSSPKFPKKKSLNRRKPIVRERARERRSSAPSVSIYNELASRQSLRLVPKGKSEMRTDCPLPIGRKSTKLILTKSETPTLSKYLTKDNDTLIKYLADLPRDQAMTMVNQRVDVEVEGVYDRFTPVGYAISENNPKLVLTLLQHGADACGRPNVMKYDENMQNVDIESPLHFAALFCCNPEIICHLEDFGANLDFVSDVARNAVVRYFADCRDETAISKLLSVIEEGCNEYQITTALHLATTNVNIPAVKALIELNIDVNGKQQSSKTALMLACKTNRLELIMLLLDAGSNVNACDHWKRTALHFAIRFCTRECIEVLLKAGANINVRDLSQKSVLQYVFLKEGSKMFRKEMEEDPGVVAGMIIKASDGKFKHYKQAEFLETLNALLKCSVEDSIIIMYMEKNISNLKKDYRGHLFLHLAIEQGKINIVKWLLEHGSCISDKDADDWCAIHHAIASRNSDMINTLLAYGADINESTKVGLTPLWLMIRHGLSEMAEHYLENGCTEFSSMKLSNIILIPCPEPTLPLEVFDPKEATDIRERARRNRRQLTLVEFALYMDQYKLAFLLCQKGAPLFVTNKTPSSNTDEPVATDQLFQVVQNLIDTKMEATVCDSKKRWLRKLSKAIKVKSQVFSAGLECTPDNTPDDVF